MAITFGNFTENVSLPLDTQYLVGYDTTVSGGERRTTLAILKQAFYLDGVTSDIQTQLNSKQGSLGFTPVQQGGGTGQGTNKVYVGWLGSTLGLQIDSNNYSNVWPISISENAATATKLQTARTINGIAFDGTANITIPTGGGGSVTSVTASSPLTVTNGTTTPAITLGVIPPSLGGAGGLTGVLKASSGTVSVATAGTDYVIPSGSITGNAATATTAGTAGTCSGNAATATKLQTARTINGIAFDGTANITIPTGGGGGGSGTVTSVTASSPLTVTNGTTTPAITLGAIPPSLGGAGGLTGMLKATAGTVSVATAGTDFQAVITGAASTIASSNLTINKALVSDASGKVHSSTVTDIELGYVSGVTSAIQTQLNGKLSSTGNAATATKLQTARTINGIAFDGTANITVPATATGANVAKAWVTFNGLTTTPTVIRSYNVTSVVRNTAGVNPSAAGSFIINFAASTFSTADYATIGTSSGGPVGTDGHLFFLNAGSDYKSTTKIIVDTARLTGTRTNSKEICVAFFE